MDPGCPDLSRFWLDVCVSKSRLSKIKILVFEIEKKENLNVDSTSQGDFDHVVRSSVGCLGSEIFWVMCLNLHIPDNAEKHCFEHKSQFLILKY